LILIGKCFWKGNLKFEIFVDADWRTVLKGDLDVELLIDTNWKMIFKGNLEFLNIYRC
jgi:hypothetical protein